MDASPNPWSVLIMGQRFRIRSARGNSYDATFLAKGPGDAGLYVRLSTGKLARLSPDRLDVSTLEPGAAGDVLALDDELLVKPPGGREERGRVVEQKDDGLALRLANGAVLSVKLDALAPGSLILLFASTDLRVGDELMVKSLSGSLYRGRAVRVEASRIEVELRNQVGPPVSLRVERLDLPSLRVLVPIELTGTGAPS
jgi:hypothetical protein